MSEKRSEIKPISEKMIRLMIEVDRMSTIIAEKSAELNRLMGMHSISSDDFNRVKTKVCAEEAAWK